jgi:hypothetical protein
VMLTPVDIKTCDVFLQRLVVSAHTATAGFGRGCCHCPLFASSTAAVTGHIVPVELPCLQTRPPAWSSYFHHVVWSSSMASGCVSLQSHTTCVRCVPTQLVLCRLLRYVSVLLGSADCYVMCAATCVFPSGLFLDSQNTRGSAQHSSGPPAHSAVAHDEKSATSCSNEDGLQNNLPVRGNMHGHFGSKTGVSPCVKQSQRWGRGP